MIFWLSGNICLHPPRRGLFQNVGKELRSLHIWKSRVEKKGNQLARRRWPGRFETCENQRECDGHD